MENTSPFDSFELQLTAAAQGFLRETAKWARFLSIMGFIAIALYIVFGLVLIAGGDAMAINNSTGGIEMGGTMRGVISLLGALLYFFPVLYLYRFANKAQMALNNTSTEYLNESLENLKSHYKYMGILTIIVLILVVLGTVLAIVGGIAAAAM